MRCLVTFIFATLSLNAFTQGDFEIPQVPVEQRQAKPCAKYALMGNENIEAIPIGMVNGLIFNSILPSSSLGFETVIGETLYDLQSNASIGDRLVGAGNSISAGWTMSLNPESFPDRGTGYNFFDGENWDEQPNERIESVRCGWPSIGQTGSGKEYSVTHPGIDTPFLITSRTMGSGDAWSQISIPMDGPSGVLWPRTATGGVDGNTIHVIGVSTPIGNGGVEFQGQDGALMYYRSLDEGNTWEQSTFPQLDTTNFLAFAGDTYAIHAREGIVAFAVFNDFRDTFVMISEDNGETWEYNVVIDFPVDNYVMDTGLPIDSLGIYGGEDFNGDGIFQEYFNSDGSGDIHIDGDGMVHVVFGGMYYMDADTTDGTTSYFPRTNGLEYWNQSYGSDNTLTIAYAYDINANGTLDLEGEIAAYFVNLAGIPSMGSNEDGDLFVTYSSIREDFSTGLQNYRHIYVVKSQDNGDTWNSENACDLTPDNNFDGLENVFASLNPNVGDTLEIIFQRDFEPGLHVRGDLDPIGINEIVSLRVPISWLDACAVLDGCSDAQACNFNPEVINDDGSCEYDTCAGCMDESACNYDDSATYDDGNCEYPEEFYDCDGICIDPTACNYLEASDNTCTYPEEFLDCDGNCAIDLEPFEIIGSLSPEEFTLNTYSVFPYIEENVYTWSVDGGVEYSSGDGQVDHLFASSGMGTVYCEQSQGTCINSEELTLVIVPQGTIIIEFGCTYSEAMNFDMSATQDDGTCIFDTDDCLGDLNLDGVVGTVDLLQLLVAFGQVCE